MLYQEKVTRWEPVERIEEVEVPAALVKLVNGRDKKYGRNGYHYMGCSCAQQGGHTIDRLYEYIQFHEADVLYRDTRGPCDCPIDPFKVD